MLGTNPDDWTHVRPLRWGLVALLVDPPPPWKPLAGIHEV